MANKSGVEFLGSDSEYDVVEGITTWELINQSDVEDDGDGDFAFSSSSEEEEIDALVDDDDGYEDDGDVIGPEGEAAGPITDGPQQDSEISLQFLRYLLDLENEDDHHQAVADVTGLEEEGPGPYTNGSASYLLALQDNDDHWYYSPGPNTNGSPSYLLALQDNDDHRYYGDYDDYDGYYDEYDLDDELMPRSLKGKFGKERIKKLGKRGGYARMKSSKKLPYQYNRPGCLHGKHGLGVQHSYI